MSTDHQSIRLQSQVIRGRHDAWRVSYIFIDFLIFCMCVCFILTLGTMRGNVGKIKNFLPWKKKKEREKETCVGGNSLRRGHLKTRGGQKKRTQQQRNNILLKWTWFHYERLYIRIFSFVRIKAPLPSCWALWLDRDIVLTTFSFFSE